MAQTTKRKFIIDTDGGVDDACALILALNNPEIEVIAITCVQGNISVNQACINVGHVLKVTNKSVPVYRGTAKPILGPHNLPTWPGHGKDGLGDTNLADSGILVQKEHACNVIYRLSCECQEKGEDLHIVLLGPLTNLALSVMLYPDLPSKIKPHNITIMGGAYLSQGNTSMTAEFNIHQDPEAGGICFDSFPLLTMVPWELCAKFPLGYEWYKNAIDHKKTESSIKKFIYDITQVYIKVTYEAEFIQADALAMAVALNPDLVTESLSLPGKVELNGTFTRGATVFDWYAKDKIKNIKIVTGINLQAFRDFVEKLL